MTQNWRSEPYIEDKIINKITPQKSNMNKTRNIHINTEITEKELIHVGIVDEIRDIIQEEAVCDLSLKYSYNLYD